MPAVPQRELLGMRIGCSVQLDPGSCFRTAIRMSSLLIYAPQNRLLHSMRIVVSYGPIAIQPAARSTLHYTTWQLCTLQGPNQGALRFGSSGPLPHRRSHQSFSSQNPCRSEAYFVEIGKVLLQVQAHAQGLQVVQWCIHTPQYYDMVQPMYIYIYICICSTTT